jgi:hypothetical protein
MRCACAAGALQGDYLDHVVRAINVSSGLVTTLAGRVGVPSPFADGTGSQASFFNPLGVTINSAGSFALVVSGVLADAHRFCVICPESTVHGMCRLMAVTALSEPLMLRQGLLRHLLDIRGRILPFQMGSEHLRHFTIRFISLLLAMAPLLSWLVLVYTTLNFAIQSTEILAPAYDF